MFRCQREPFLKNLETAVVSCEQIPDVESARKKLGLDDLPLDSQVLYEVILEETILFPEGGGQPDDRGTIGGAVVVRVIRNGNTAVHYVIPAAPSSENDSLVNGVPLLPFAKDQKVLVEIDWTRRFDHMQQHSGQHLITAIADQTFGFPTTSWYLGKEDSFIEMDTKVISEAQLQQLEDIVNGHIRDSLPCTVEVVELDDPKLKTARGRNLPADVTGNIRIVTMTGIESNVCCGTHVQSLSQLQAIKLLSVIPRKGKSLLYFLSGNRVLRRMSEMLKREGDLMKTLKTNPADLPSACEKMNISLRNTKKALSTLSKELASIDAAKFLQDQLATNNNFCHFHRENAEPEYSAVFTREIGTVKNGIVFLTFKTDASSGNIYLIRGEESTLDVKEFQGYCDQVSTLLKGKGSLRGNQYQAKITHVGGITKAVTYLQNALKSQ